MRRAESCVAFKPVVLAILLAFPAQQALAATCDWNTTNGNWNALANWVNCATGNGNPAQTPGSVDTANIGAPGVVTVNTAQSVRNLNNAGQIQLDASTLTLSGGGTTVNTGTIDVGGAGPATLQMNSSHSITNTGGVINIANASVMNQGGGAIAGGTINTTGSGVLRAVSSSSNYLDGVALNGTLDMASVLSNRNRVVNGLTLNGTANLNNFGILSFEGTQTLGGTGSIVFGSSSVTGNRIALDGSGTTTFGAGITVRGENGTIGNHLNSSGTQTLVNNGTIHADTTGGVITFIESELVNNGLLRASTGTLNVGVPLSGTGTLQVDAGGQMNLANGAKTQGQLQMGAAGAALNLGTGNLTISGDYTNAGAGTGNAFDRRAGISGAGQIVAAADATQAITGAGVSNGASPNATLTIGNVRVGATTYDYQVANTGSTGPALRGAIQTSVNGANLTDARLSGSGVTAANYNAGGPGTNSGDQAVTFTATSAGTLAPLTGQVLNLRSNFENIADQKLNIVLDTGAAAFNAAVGSVTPAPAAVANQRVGGNNVTALTIANTAATGGYSEDLNASVSGSSGNAGFSGAGSVGGLLAGASNNTAVSVNVDTSSAGAKAGTVTLAYQTAGTVGGVSNGLGTASVGADVVSVSGNVYQAAAGAIQSPALNFGTVQVGQVVTQNLVIRNTATGEAGFVEDLNASFGASTGTGAGLISGSGSLNGILAGTNSTAGNGGMTVSVNTATAGVVNGGIAVNYASAGAVAGVSNGLGVLSVGSESYGVNGNIEAIANVINQASPQINNPIIDLGAMRVGGASPTANVSVSNLATVAPQAALNASISPSSGPVTASGSFNLLNPGATDNTSLTVGLATTTAGNFTGANAGQATIAFVSDASNVGGCAPNCELNLATQTVSVTGKVYTQAVGDVAPATIDFGVVRVGDTVSAQNITVQNVAAISALNDTMRAELTAAGPFVGGGSVAGIGAGDSGSIGVGLNTAAAGVYNTTAAVDFLIQNMDMSDVSAGSGTVGLQAQVNNLANADFDLLSGLGVLSQSGTDYLLDFGNLTLGSMISALLQLDNDVSGPADLLSGDFDFLDPLDFMYGGWAGMSNLAAGDATAGMTVGFNASGLGLFSDEILFSGFGTNASDPTGLAQSRRLLIRANVVDVATVPEPGSMALVLAALVIGAALRRRHPAN